MFEKADSFNGDISSCDVSNITDMSYMFKDADIFNGDVSFINISELSEEFKIPSIKLDNSFNL